MKQARPFHLGHEWHVRGRIEDVFYFISHIATWPDWWPQIVSAQTAEPDREVVRVGDTATMRAKSMLPYRLDWQTEVLRIESPKLIETRGIVSLAGKYGLSGTIRFELEQHGALVRVMNSQEMVSDKPVAPWLWPVYSAIFSFNHDYAMKRGLAGLERACSNRLAGSLATNRA